jgi:hypothetical protein
MHNTYLHTTSRNCQPLISCDDIHSGDDGGNLIFAMGCRCVRLTEFVCNYPNQLP